VPGERYLLKTATLAIAGHDGPARPPTKYSVRLLVSEPSCGDPLVSLPNRTDQLLATATRQLVFVIPYERFKSPINPSFSSAKAASK